MKTFAKASVALGAVAGGRVGLRYPRDLLRPRAQLVCRRPGRSAYATLAAALAASAVVVVVVWDAAWWPAVAFALAPDLGVLYGTAPGLSPGQLHPRAVPLYNALHRFWGPLALALAVLATGLPFAYIAGALAWAGHVACDRAIGLRLRTRDGFQRGTSA